jgi:hypothetical protein
VLLSLSRRCVNPLRPNNFVFGLRSHLMLLVISHYSRTHFGMYSSVPEDCFSYHFFLHPKVGYPMVAQLPYTRTIWYHTPTSRYPLERGGTKIKKKLLGASSHNSVRLIINWECYGVPLKVHFATVQPPTAVTARTKYIHTSNMMRRAKNTIIPGGTD